MDFIYQCRFVPYQLVAANIILTLLLFIPQILLNFQAYSNFNRITIHEFEVQKLSDKINYFDEVLTMSAWMNAATGNLIWEQRYREFEPTQFCY